MDNSVAEPELSDPSATLVGMGYDTAFDGKVTVKPPLNEHEIAYLTAFSRSRRMEWRTGPYRVDGDDSDPDVINGDEPPSEQPGLWCKWVPVENGTAIAWNGEEKFYFATEWMRYLIDTFLRPGAALQHELVRPVEGRVYPEALAHFTFDHEMKGVIKAKGEERGDRWRIVVRCNKVS